MTAPSTERRPKHAANDGALPPWWSALDRRRLVVALGSTFVAVPVVVVDNLPQGTSDAVEVVAEEPAPTATSTTTPPTSATITVESSTTTVTTAAPAPAPTTTAAPAPASAPAPTTTTTAAPAPPPAGASESGKATWYRYRDGECAHKTLPKGTVLTVTNVANGASATCVVTDRGPYGGGRVVDLDDGTFVELAPLSAGVIDVTISW